MMDAILNNKRRLERHTRRDGRLQSRARPASLEKRSEGDGEAAVAYIRSFVEESDLARRFNIFSMGQQDAPAPSSTDDSGVASTSADSDAPTVTRGNSGNTAADNNYTAPSATHTRARATTTQQQDTAVAAPSTTVVQNTYTAPAAITKASHTHAVVASTTAAVLTTSAANVLSTASSASLATGLSTAVAFVTASPTASADVAASSSTSTSKPDSGVGVGPIIGIVAGCLAGIAVIAVIVGYLLKKFGRKEDPYEADPFSPDDFRRQSAMLPETFESEDGFNDMAEYQNNMGPFGHDNGYGGAAAAGAGIGAGAMAGGLAASSFTSHNESGRPRPPTMFQKHINGQAAYNGNDAGLQVGNVYHPDDLSPQMPSMAYGGSDPYSIAGVGRNHQMDSNISNPYAHLDRTPSSMVQRNVSQGGQNDRSLGSNASSYQQYESAGNEYESTGHGHDTAGRPGTSEGRSGTPDLPNVQQTYAGTGIDGRQEMNRALSPHHMLASPEQMPHEFYDQAGYHDGNAPNQQPLQVRNLLPNSRNMQQPRTNAVGGNAHEDDAYGGVW